MEISTSVKQSWNWGKKDLNLLLKSHQILSVCLYLVSKIRQFINLLRTSVVQIKQILVV